MKFHLLNRYNKGYMLPVVVHKTFAKFLKKADSSFKRKKLKNFLNLNSMKNSVVQKRLGDSITSANKDKNKSSLRLAKVEEPKKEVKKLNRVKTMIDAVKSQIFNIKNPNIYITINMNNGNAELQHDKDE